MRLSYTENKAKQVNLVFFITILADIILGFVVSALSFKGIDFFGSSFAFQLLFSQLFFLAPAAVYFFGFSRDFSLLRIKKIDFVTILLCILLYICILPVFTFVNSISLMYSSNVISGVMVGVGGEMPYIVAVLLTAVIPALCEEFTYRGVFYNSYRKYSPLGAVIMCGLVFGFLHGNLNQFSYAFLLGSFFALVVEATDSLLSSVIVHTLVNSVSISLIYLIPKMYRYVENMYNDAVAAGDSTTANMLSEFIMSDEEAMEIMSETASGTVSSAEAFTSIVNSLVPAIIGGVIAFYIFRKIATRCGRWENICAIFSSKKEEENPLIPEERRGWRSLITWEFVAAASIMLIQMVANELIIRGVISIK